MCYPTRHYLFSQMDDSSETGAKVRNNQKLGIRISVFFAV